MSTSQYDARRLTTALANLIEDPVRLVMAEWNSHGGRLMCEACHRTIESGHDEDCPHHQWILDVRLAVRRILSALTTEETAKESIRAALAAAFDAGVDAEQGGNFRPHGHEAKRFDVVNRLAPLSRSLTPDAGKDDKEP